MPALIRGLIILFIDLENFQVNSFKSDNNCKMAMPFTSRREYPICSENLGGRYAPPDGFGYRTQKKKKMGSSCHEELVCFISHTPSTPERASPQAWWHLVACQSLFSARSP